MTEEYVRPKICPPPYELLSFSGNFSERLQKITAFWVGFENAKQLYEREWCWNCISIKLFNLNSVGLHLKNQENLKTRRKFVENFGWLRLLSKSQPGFSNVPKLRIFIFSRKITCRNYPPYTYKMITIIDILVE